MSCALSAKPSENRAVTNSCGNDSGISSWVKSSSWICVCPTGREGDVLEHNRCNVSLTYWVVSGRRNSCVVYVV